MWTEENGSPWPRRPAGQPGQLHSAHNLNVRVKHGRLEVRRNFFSVRASGQWNEIPGHIKDLKTVGVFKAAYARHRQNIAQRG